MNIAPTLEAERATVGIDQLISFQAVAEATGLSWHQVRRRADKGVFETVWLPNGSRAVVRASLNAYLAERGKK